MLGQGEDYVLALKENHPQLVADVQECFAQTQARSVAGVPLVRVLQPVRWAAAAIVTSSERVVTQEQIAVHRWRLARTSYDKS